MSATMAVVYVLLQKYLVPFFLVVGLYFFIQGIIYYFIIDGEQGHGKVSFLRAISWFVIAIIAYVLVSGIGWLVARSVQLQSNPTQIETQFDTRIKSDSGVLPVPNAPREND